MGENPPGARKNGKFRAVSTAPSFNHTPVGDAKPPIAYPASHDLSNSVSTASSVRFNGDPAYVLDKTVQPECTGPEPGTAGGVISGTVNGEIRPVSASTTVNAEKKSVVREGDDCTLNSGNCPGKYVTEPSPAAPGDSGDPEIVPETPAEKSFLEKIGDWLRQTGSEMGEAVKHPVDAGIGAIKDAVNTIPEIAELITKGDMLEKADYVEENAYLLKFLGMDETGDKMLESAELMRDSADNISLPKFDLSNPAQKGGAKIAIAAGAVTGVYGVSKYAARKGAKIASKTAKAEAKAVAETAENAAKAEAAAVKNADEMADAGKAADDVPDGAVKSEGAENPGDGVRVEGNADGAGDGAKKGRQSDTDKKAQEENQIVDPKSEIGDRRMSDVSDTTQHSALERSEEIKQLRGKSHDFGETFNVADLKDTKTGKTRRVITSNLENKTAPRNINLKPNEEYVHPGPNIVRRPVKGPDGKILKDANGKIVRQNYEKIEIDGETIYKPYDKKTNTRHHAEQRLKRVQKPEELIVDSAPTRKMCDDCKRAFGDDLEKVPDHLK